MREKRYNWAHVSWIVCVVERVPVHNKRVAADLLHLLLLNLPEACLLYVSGRAYKFRTCQLGCQMCSALNG